MKVSPIPNDRKGSGPLRCLLTVWVLAGGAFAPLAAQDGSSSFDPEAFDAYVTAAVEEWGA